MGLYLDIYIEREPSFIFENYVENEQLCLGFFFRCFILTVTVTRIIRAYYAENMSSRARCMMKYENAYIF